MPLARIEGDDDELYFAEDGLDINELKATLKLEYRNISLPTRRHGRSVLLSMASSPYHGYIASILNRKVATRETTVSNEMFQSTNRSNHAEWRSRFAMRYMCSYVVEEKDAASGESIDTGSIWFCARKELPMSSSEDSNCFVWMTNSQVLRQIIESSGLSNFLTTYPKTHNSEMLDLSMLNGLGPSLTHVSDTHRDVKKEAGDVTPPSFMHGSFQSLVAKATNGLNFEPDEEIQASPSSSQQHRNEPRSPVTISSFPKPPAKRTHMLPSAPRALDPPPPVKRFKESTPTPKDSNYRYLYEKERLVNRTQKIQFEAQQKAQQTVISQLHDELAAQITSHHAVELENMKLISKVAELENSLHESMARSITMVARANATNHDHEHSSNASQLENTLKAITTSLANGINTQ